MSQTEPSIESSNTAAVSFERVHQRLGHLGSHSIEQLINKNMLVGLNIAKRPAIAAEDQAPCGGCLAGRHVAKPSGGPMGVAPRRVMRTHIDVCGPFDASVRGHKYLLSVTDDHSRLSDVFFLKSKSEVLTKLKEYERRVTAETLLPMVYLRGDNAGENTSNALKAWLKQKGITLELTIPYTAMENGVAERFNRTVLDKARSMLHFAGLPTSFWCLAVQTAVYLKNRSPSQILDDMTPLEAWSGVKPSVTHLRVFGCPAWDRTAPEKRESKLHPRSK
jgi:hypothetical protein